MQLIKVAGKSGLAPVPSSGWRKDVVIGHRPTGGQLLVHSPDQSCSPCTLIPGSAAHRTARSEVAVAGPYNASVLAGRARREQQRDERDEDLHWPGSCRSRHDILGRPKWWAGGQVEGVSLDWRLRSTAGRRGPLFWPMT